MHDDAQSLISVGDAPGDPWSATRKVAFRFAFAYFVLYNFPFPLSNFPVPDPISEANRTVWQAVVPWVGTHVLRLATPITTFENGSGDTTYNYVLVLCFAFLAVAATALWSLLDRGRLNYAVLHKWFRIYLRFALATTMIAYGSMKVIKAQFPSPGLYSLVESYGDSSPMGLLWNFMGYSLPYNLFTGMAEMGAGFLLAFRRTTMLGAALAIAVLSNVAMLNFSYDVPVKLYSLHLLAMAVLILLPDVGRLIDVFLLNRSVRANPAPPVFARARLDLASRILGTVFVVASAGVWMSNSIDGRKQFGDAAPKSQLYGVYEIATLVRNGDTVPLLRNDEAQWRRIFIVYPGRLTIFTVGDSALRFAAEVDTARSLLALSPRQDSTMHYALTYSWPDSAHLTLTGAWAADSIRLELTRRIEKDFLLMNRGFHWINEEPFNQ